MIRIGREPRKTTSSKQGQRVVFLLASPRSGSTLLRVMLAGHSALFCPPELNLLPYRTMGEREQALGSCHAIQCMNRGCDQREGLLRGVMELFSVSADEGKTIIKDWVERDLPIAEVYRIIQQLASPRTLVDKSPLNAATLDTLYRAEQLFENPLYIYLVRHPYAVIESLLRQRQDIMDAPQPESLAEKFWMVTNANIIEFLNTVERERKHLIRFETLVSHPTQMMKELCDFLRLAFEEMVLNPYEGDRMTSGIRPHTPSLGDPNFFKHQKIDATLGEVWRAIKLPHQLSSTTQHVALELQYELPNEVQGRT